MNTYRVELNVKADTDPSAWDWQRIIALAGGELADETYIYELDRGKCAVCGDTFPECAGCGTSMPTPHEQVCEAHSHIYIAVRRG